MMKKVIIILLPILLLFSTTVKTIETSEHSLSQMDVVSHTQTESRDKGFVHRQNNSESLIQSYIQALDIVDEDFSQNGLTFTFTGNRIVNIHSIFNFLFARKQKIFCENSKGFQPTTKTFIRIRSIRI